MRKYKEYAIYKGEECLVIGTAKECAEVLDVSQDAIYWMANPSVHKRSKGNRKIAIRLDD